MRLAQYLRVPRRDGIAADFVLAVFDCVGEFLGQPIGVPVPATLGHPFFPDHANGTLGRDMVYSGLCELNRVIAATFAIIAPWGASDNLSGASYVCRIV